MRRAFQMHKKPLAQVALDPHFQAALHVGHYPCWLHRVLQRWFLGVYWRRV